jgi:hypothetical protein
LLLLALQEPPAKPHTSVTEPVRQAVSLSVCLLQAGSLFERGVGTAFLDALRRAVAPTVGSEGPEVARPSKGGVHDAPSAACAAAIRNLAAFLEATSLRGQEDMQLCLAETLTHIAGSCAASGGWLVRWACPPASTALSASLSAEIRILLMAAK